ncbi:unnamed protein product, partial [Vitis vinifera]|uniref:Cytochrome P450 n=1 Tax=Vitis vinifera TaxID=29760 RepID=D7U7J0_VITVI
MSHTNYYIIKIYVKTILIARHYVKTILIVIKYLQITTKRYTIPKGWIVVVCPSVPHLDPTKYKDPFAFNPWRWEGQELHAGSKNFMAFGGGVRLCAGAHFAKLQMAIFLHYLVTKYRYLISFFLF